MSQKYQIDFERLKGDLLELSAIGQSSDGEGIDRRGFSPADMQGRQWLINKFKALSIPARMDTAGNVIARLESASNRDRAAVVSGSHLDTVPAGGHLDGALGVVAVLECLRVIKERDLQTRHPLEAVAFSDEEGRFGGMFGSLAMAGLLSPKRIRESIDLDGISIMDAMQSVGLNAMDALAARRTPESMHSFVELHIEQGPVLDSNQQQIGIVEAITGLFKWNVRLIGETNHAGTTPMHLRHDSFSGLAEFCGEINRILEEHGGEHSVATIGKVSLSPGNANSVPGTTLFSLDVRDTSQSGLDNLADAIRRTLSAIARRRGLMFEFDILSEIKPVECSSHIVEAVESIVTRSGLPACKMPSGAAHDAQTIASIAPVGMIMIPSIGGRSHSAAEWSHWEDIAAGTNVLLETLIQLAEET
ncbi:MAG: Zn-dependent hydrolase [Leptospiraceae bacterium]|nr:Zn-dependent hydrolase [Leptospiraceae bacterium]